MMKDEYHSDFDISYEGLYSELTRLRSDNYYLKREIRRSRRINRDQSKLIDLMNHKIKRLEKRRRDRRDDLIDD
jgi:septal ring factor EnvC (AmiA/AmiB activator)